jgi:carbamoyl-phosphate synthase large subunit
MGKASLLAADLPVAIDKETVINHPVEIGGANYNITCVSVGNPHCVVFAPRVDAVEVEKVGPLFEHSPLFPERVNTEFIRVVNPVTIKMRVWERGNGETLACGTGACAAVVAAVENGFCKKGEDVTVKVKGGDLIVNYTDDGITLTGNADLVFKGELEY